MNSVIGSNSIVSMHASKETYFAYIYLMLYMSQYQQRTSINTPAEKTYSKLALVNIYQTKAI
jgi:hypothetical protein